MAGARKAFESIAEPWLQLYPQTVQLLIDKGELQQAKDLLLSVPFQKVHQTYTRTGLCKQAINWQVQVHNNKISGDYSANYLALI